MSVDYTPTVSDNAAEELRTFEEGYNIRSFDAANGEIFFDSSRAFALLANDATHLGDGEGNREMDIEPFNVEYDRAERVEGNGTTVKMWVFESETHTIAVAWKYIEMVREIFGLSLNEIRQKAKAAGENGDATPLIIETEEHEYRGLIMPHKSLSEEK